MSAFCMGFLFDSSCFW